MFNVEMANYVYELIQEEIDKRLNSKPGEYHSKCPYGFTELLAMSTTASTFCTLMTEEWSEDTCRNYIHNMLSL